MKLRKITLLLITLMLFSLVSCASYKPVITEQEYQDIYSNVQISKKGTTYVISSEQSDSAFIFYPGGYVNYESYIPLLSKIAEKGITCFLVKMPRNLAIYNIDAAEKIRNNLEFSNINHWYIGGHSLGGAMSAINVSKKSDEYEGLVLMAAFSTKDLSAAGVEVLSIYGSNDGVLNLQKYNDYKVNLPEDYEEHVLEGGNHAQFGSYGVQKGDNAATMTAEEQQNQTAEFLYEWQKKILQNN